jgi:thiamine-phosphate pyrophosphorylase
MLSRMSHAEQTRLLVDAGATLIQLRDKQATPREFLSDASRAVEIAHEKGARVIINDRVDIAMMAKADGVHLGQDDLPPAEARKLLGDASLIGFSTHDLDQVRKAVAFPIDYLAIGPIFETATKSDISPTVGLAGLAAAKALADGIPVVAIGGLWATNLGPVLQEGADSAAVISELFRGSDISSQYEKLVSLAEFPRSNMFVPR